uniref:Uncharacterized protein n=1 Tax=Marmota marmota marmota TaxID=9994 RepID=A0A8C5ZHF5_MARMA
MPHSSQLYQHVPETHWPIVYSPRYNITFMGLEKLHPFDAGKWGKVINFLKGSEGFLGPCVGFLTPRVLPILIPMGSIRLLPLDSTITFPCALPCVAKASSSTDSQARCIPDSPSVAPHCCG